MVHQGLLVLMEQMVLQELQAQTEQMVAQGLLVLMEQMVLQELAV